MRTLVAAQGSKVIDRLMPVTEEDLDVLHDHFPYMHEAFDVAPRFAPAPAPAQAQSMDLDARPLPIPTPLPRAM